MYLAVLFDFLCFIFVCGFMLFNLTSHCTSCRCCFVSAYWKGAPERGRHASLAYVLIIFPGLFKEPISTKLYSLD